MLRSASPPRSPRLRGLASSDGTDPGKMEHGSSTHKRGPWQWSAGVHYAGPGGRLRYAGRGSPSRPLQRDRREFARRTAVAGCVSGGLFFPCERFNCIRSAPVRSPGSGRASRMLHAAAPPRPTNLLPRPTLPRRRPTATTMIVARPPRGTGMEALSEPERVICECIQHPSPPSST